MVQTKTSYRIGQLNGLKVAIIYLLVILVSVSWTYDVYQFQNIDKIELKDSSEKSEKKSESKENEINAEEFIFSSTFRSLKLSIDYQANHLFDFLDSSKDASREVLTPPPERL